MESSPKLNISLPSGKLKHLNLCFGVWRLSFGWLLILKNCQSTPHIIYKNTGLNLRKKFLLCSQRRKPSSYLIVTIFFLSWHYGADWFMSSPMGCFPHLDLVLDHPETWEKSLNILRMCFWLTEMLGFFLFHCNGLCKVLSYEHGPLLLGM